MTEILIYQLQRQPLERVLPALIEKSLERGWRVIVQAASEERVAALEDALARRSVLAVRIGAVEEGEPGRIRAER